MTSVLRCALLVVAICSLAPAAQAQTVLIYDGGGNAFAVDACRRLGLMYEVVSSGGDLVAPLTGAPPELVVVDMPSSEPAGSWEEALIAHVERGGALIFSHWNRSSLTRLPSVLGATIEGEHDTLPFYPWRDGSVFDAPERVPTPFESLTDVWGTNGFFLRPLDSAYAVSGFTPTEEPGRAAIVIGNADRTIFNGFLIDDGSGDADRDGIPDMTELVMNEISFVLGGGGIAGPCDGLREGEACTSPRGAGTCYAGSCCTGCWDGTSCRGGSTASTCGVGGGRCRSCVDDVTCTSDVCTVGVCSNPPAPSSTACDDGLFCTATDRCAGTSPTCVGSGTPCDDGESCTLDVCDEGTRACNHTMTSGCFIGGVCVGAGVGHVAYPCLVCDPSRDATDWSPRVVGEPCGSARCAAGRLTGAGACDAAGACVAPAPTRCPTGVCADASSCAAACSETGCPPDRYCAPSGLCMALLAEGTSCSDSATCASGFCVDGVCCDASCDGTCEACDGARDGTCAPTTAGADPDNECALACDGAGACQDPPDAPRDAGAAVDAGADAGASFDASTARDAGSPTPPMGRSCACRAATSRQSAPTLVLAGLVALALARRRRP